MEKRVEVIAVSTILPVTYQVTTVPKRIDLTPWDLRFLLVSPMKYGLVFNSNMEPELLERLKKSLSRTLDFFYPLAGCLRSIEDVSIDSTLFYIECNNVGVEFTHAATDVITIDDVLQPVYDFSLMNLLCAGKLENECGAKRFLAVQATELANGGFFLSCSMSHAFGDGSSFWHFFNSWSEICRGCDSPNNPPLLERCYPGQAEIWIPNQLIAPLKPSDKDDHFSQPALKEKNYIFPKEKLALLKQKAIEQTGNQTISSLQAMLAFAWTLTSRYRQIQDEDIVRLFMPINVRTRVLEPPLTDYYLGNAIHPTSTTMKAKDLRDDDAFGHAASRVHDTVASQSEATVKNFLTSWVEKPFIWKSNGKKPTNIAFLRSSPRFKVYGNDFGWGRPVAVRGGAKSEIEGRITLFEGPENGSVHMKLCLLPETLELLENDSNFLNYVRV